MSSAQTSGRTASVYAPIHICVAYTNQLVYDLKDALQKQKTNMVIIFLHYSHLQPAPAVRLILKNIGSRSAWAKEVYLFLIEG